VRSTSFSYDDSFSPSKTVEQARKLVENDEVLLIFQSLGTVTNAAIQKYMNTRKVPQLFVSTGASRWNDPQSFPWTMGWQPNFQNEARIYAKYILKEKPDARIGILYQNDDFGKDYLKGLKDGLDDKAASLIVAEYAYDVTEPTIDSHVIGMKSLNVDVFVDVTSPKFTREPPGRRPRSLEAAPYPRQRLSVGWRRLKPAGLEAAQGIISSTYIKDPTDRQWKNDPGLEGLERIPG
jgi:hypothetical protein